MNFLSIALGSISRLKQKAAPDNACIVVVIDSIEDAITGTNKVFNIERLLSTEKHVGLRAIRVISV